MKEKQRKYSFPIKISRESVLYYSQHITQGIHETANEIVKALLDGLDDSEKPKYFYDLDYQIPIIGLSRTELNEIIVEADTIIMESKEAKENLAVAYLKKAQCLQKLEEYNQFENIETIDDYRNIDVNTQEQIKNLIEKALEIIPNMPEALMQLGKYYFKISISGNENIDNAIDMYTTAIKIKPDYAAAYNNRGVLYASEIYSRENNSPIENWTKAINDFSEAIRIRPSDAIYYFNSGRNYSKLKEHEKAIDDFSCSIFCGSDEFMKKIPLYYLRGEEYTEIQEYKKAIEGFSEQIRLIPDFIKSFLMRGNAYLCIGEKEKAKADFDEYLKLKQVKEACS